MTLLGEGFVFLSALSYALASLLIKSYSQKEHPVTLSGFSPLSLLLLLYMAFISVAAFTIWGILLKYNPVGRVAIFGFTNPFFGVLLSALFLEESAQAFGIKELLALLLICAGIFVVNRESAS